MYYMKNNAESRLKQNAQQKIKIMCYIRPN